MRLSDFDFHLPEANIALRPVEPRDAARMLVVRPGLVCPLSDHHVGDLGDLLVPGDVLVLNDTRVIPSRLYGLRLKGETAAWVEMMLHKRLGADGWLAFARPAKKLAIGDVVRFGQNAADAACQAMRLDARVVGKGEGGEVELAFELAGPHLDEAVMRLGELPLPPYIGHAPDAEDEDRYQTVYAKHPGAVAAPTAGLQQTSTVSAGRDWQGTRLVAPRVGRR
jgi:S-adenosylmethionine:tRNA ribosyltransferase-isomerase